MDLNWRLVRLLLTASILLAVGTAHAFQAIFGSKLAYFVGLVVGGSAVVGLAPVLLGLIVSGV